MGINKEERREKIKKRIRKNILGTSARPRLTVYRSNKEIYAQVVDDLKKITLVSVSSRTKGIVGDKQTKIEQATLVGKAIAKKAKDSGIETVVFDRNGYIYHGRVKSLAEGAREGGLIF